MKKKNFDNVIELDSLTIQDCINVYNELHMSILIENGIVVDLIQE